MTEDQYTKTWTGKVKNPKEAKKFPPLGDFAAASGLPITPGCTGSAATSGTFGAGGTSAATASPHAAATPPATKAKSGPEAQANPAKSGNSGNSGRPGGKPPRTPKPRRSLPMRVLRGFAFTLLWAVGLLVLAIAYITSPLGEKPLTALTLRVANAALAPHGLRMGLSSLAGFWDGEVRIYGLKLYDKDGEWLDMAEAAIYPSWVKVTRTVAESARMAYKLHLADDPTGSSTVAIEVRRATLFDLSLQRLPQLSPPVGPTLPREPGPIRILPAWLELDVGELELVRCALLQGENGLYINMHGNAHVSDTQLALRAGVYVSTNLRWLKGAPVPDVLVGDVTRTMRELQAAAEREGLQVTVEGGAEQTGNPPSGAALGTATQATGVTTNSTAGPTVGPATGQAAGVTAQNQPAGPKTGASLPPRPSTAPTAGDKTSPSSNGTSPTRTADNFVKGVVNVVWDGNFLDARWQVRDTLLLQRYIPGVERLWSRSRLQVQLSQWPPDKEHPLQARMASRFGLTTADLPERVRASLFSGQMFWDGHTLVVRDLDLQVPIRVPQVQLRGSFGMSPTSGPGAGMLLKLVDLGPLAQTLGLKALEGKVSGAVDVGMAIGRGGRHSLWWARPLPEPEGFITNVLPGFVAAPLPPALKDADAAEAGSADTPINTKPKSFGDGFDESPMWKDMRASRAPTALQAVLRLKSNSLKLPGGNMDKVDLLLRGVSMDADVAPEGTTQRKKGKTEETVDVTAQDTATPQADTNDDKDSADFSLKGLPKGMVGEMRFSAASLFDMGDARLQSLWMLGGIHGDADVLLLELSELAGNIPGLSMGGGIGFSYALPVRRLWPWVDGRLNIQVDNWKALAKLVKSPLQGSNMSVKLEMESRYNENNMPRQYLKADVKAQEVETPQFNVRGVRGSVESDHVHALADVLALSLVPMSRRQDMPAEDVPKDMNLLKADLQMGPGSGGPVQWNFGQCQVKVAGEDARIEANLRGSVQGVLEGFFNFRQRLLQIKKLEVSDSQGRGGRLLTPVRLALAEKPGLAPVDVALLPQGRLRLSAELKDGARREGGEAATPGPFLQTEARLWGFSGQNAPEADSPSVLRASARLPVTLSEESWLAPDRTRPFQAEARWQGQLLPLWKLLPLPGRSLSGEASVAAEVQGTWDAPRLSANVILRDASFVDSLEGVALRDIQLHLAHTSGQASLLGTSRLDLRASDGRGGSLGLQGSLEQRGTDLFVAAKGNLNKLQPLHRDDLRLSVSGDLSLDGPLLGKAGQEGALLQGQLRLDKGSFTLLGGFTPAVRGLDKVEEGRGVPGPPGPARPALQQVAGKGTATKAVTVTAAETTQLPVLLLPHLNIQCSAPGQFFIEGKGLESEWKADLKVSGPVSAPRLLGQLAPVRGTFTLLGRQFRFERGQIHFAGAWPPDPSLDLALAYQNPQLTALVLVQGQARAPRLTLTSEPALPRDEVMAQVLFGKDMRNLSRFEAIQAANSARQLVDLGPSALDVMASVRQALGLEVLRLGSSTASSSAPGRKGTPGKSAGGDMAEDNTTLQAGKYLTDQIYVGVEQGLRPETSAVRVEVELTPRISVTGRTSTESSGVGLNWKLDY